MIDVARSPSEAVITSAPGATVVAEPPTSARPAIRLPVTTPTVTPSVPSTADVAPPPSLTELTTAPSQSGVTSTVTAAEPAPGALPMGDPFTERGERTYRVVPGSSVVYGTSSDVVTYSVEIENGVTPVEGDAAFAEFVERTLADQRSWTSVQDVSLRRVDSTAAAPRFRVTLTSQLTVRDVCGYDVLIESSCYTGMGRRVVLNDARWVRGAYSYAGDLTSYRQYAINHEVGHALDNGHQACQTNGDLAPVMMQQTWSTSNDVLRAINGSVAADGKSCRANPWPNPEGLDQPAATRTPRS